MTQKGIDDWRAQLYGYRLDSFPKSKPEHMPEEIYDELKRKYVYQRKFKTKSKSPTDSNYNSVNKNAAKKKGSAVSTALIQSRVSPNNQSMANQLN